MSVSDISKPRESLWATELMGPQHVRLMTLIDSYWAASVEYAAFWRTYWTGNVSLQYGSVAGGFD